MRISPPTVIASVATRDLGAPIPTTATIPIQPLAESTPEAEVARVLNVCNACRYCEGFCAVFPAMTRRLEFDATDVHYFANLCHNCGACLHACQYAPPHFFAVNVPRAMARVRLRTYARYAWPAPLGRLYERNGLVLVLALAAACACFIAFVFLRNGALFSTLAPGDFYRLVPHETMVALFLPVFGFAVTALAIGVARFWRAGDPGAPPGDARAEAVRDVLRLKYLDGGHGEGCNEQDDRFTLVRRRAHHLVFYGFLACFAATCVGTLYHYLFDWRAPYDFFSVPKLLGTVGGVAILIGGIGLLWLHLRRDPAHGDPAQRPMDMAFIVLLLLVAATGLVLMVFRDARALGLLLALHLGAVMAFFLTLPYGKFAHAVYRAAALLKWAVERRTPNPVGLPDDG